MRGGFWRCSAREGCGGPMIDRLSQYMFLWRAPPMMSVPLKERVAKPSRRSEDTPARSSRGPLSKLERAAGTWRTLCKIIVHVLVPCRPCTRTVPLPIATVERSRPNPLMQSGSMDVYVSNAVLSWKTWRLAPESWWHVLLRVIVCSKMGRLATIVSPSRSLFQSYVGVSAVVTELMVIWSSVVVRSGEMLARDDESG
jgi:hypothetical protein